MTTEANEVSKPNDQGVGDQPLVHTPGPWTADHGDCMEQDSERWSVFAERDGKQYFVATIENGAPGDTLDTEEANAKLMAAAPDMLEVLREVALPPYPDSDLASLLETLRMRAKSVLEKVV